MNPATAAPLAPLPTATPAQRPATPSGLAAALGGATNVPRLSLPQRIGQGLIALGQRIAAALTGIGNLLTGCVRADAQYDRTALDAWVNAAVEGENRLEAAARIRASEGHLDLSRLGLRQLPPLPADLYQLDCSDNNLAQVQALPAGLQNLFCNNNPLTHLSGLPSSLEYLETSECPLAALPPLPSNLKVLDANCCGLTSVPSEWPSGLRILSLQGNQISAIPSLPTTPGLKCYLNDNELTALPGNLNELPSCELELTGNRFTAEALACLSQLNSADYNGTRITFSIEDSLVTPGARPLYEAVAAWYAWNPLEAGAEASQGWGAFANEPGAIQFSAFLDKLATSIDATDPALAGAFRAHIGQWLLHLAAEPALRADTFAMVAPGNESCDDRAALVLLQMTRLRVNHDVATGHFDAQPAALLAALRGNFRLEALEAIALEKLQSIRVSDDVETILAYPVGLRDRLQLPIGVGAMRYLRFAEVSEADLDRAQAQVLALDIAFPAYLANHEPFHDVLQRWQPERFAQAQAQRDACLETGDYDVRVQLRIAQTAAELHDDPAARGQAGRAVLEELHQELFGPLVKDYMEASHPLPDEGAFSTRKTGGTHDS
jgi:hypothetical protein